MRLLVLLVASGVIAAGCKRDKPMEATHVWLGDTMGCATYTNGTFACWGDNEGKDTLREPITPKYEDALGDAGLVALSVDGHEVCAIVTGGRVSCWGHKSYSPIEAGALEIANQCVRTANEVLCWWLPGSAHFGEKPEVPPAFRGEHVTKIAAGLTTVCALLTDARGVSCVRFSEPKKPPVLAGADVKSITVGEDHACALLADRSVRCWGSNRFGQLGDGSTSDSAESVPVHGLGDVAEVHAGRFHTCALLVNATVSCWGHNDHHQLANGTMDDSPRPVPLFGLVGVVDLAVARDSACIRLRRDGEIRCWGDNGHAQLGDGTRVAHDVPMSVRSPH